MERIATCPSCHRGVFAEDAFCGWCGARIQARNDRTGVSRRTLSSSTVPTGERRSCASCHSVILPGDQFCSTCGARHVVEIVTRGLGGSWPAIGRRVTEASRGKYRIYGELGRGGMGIVLAARDNELDRPVAIKVLAPALLADDAMIERFQREARTIASLRHESIVNVYEVGRADDLHYFVMDYIDGVSLSRILELHGPLPISAIEVILLQVGSALAYAHGPSRRVVHRDIKPSNIMIGSEGVAVVMDFGISKVSQAPGGLTRTGLVIGTAEYMSPEHCRGSAVTPESDQYALGAVLFALLTGAPPYTGPFYRVLMAHETEPVPSVLEARPDCPPELADAIERMLAKRAAERWPSVWHALRALQLRRPLPGDPVLDDLAHLVRVSAATGQAAADFRTPAALRIATVPAGLGVGDKVELTATLFFSDGGEEIPSGIRWQSTAPGVVRVDADSGELVAAGAGTAEITASFGGFAHSVSVEVARPGDSRWRASRSLLTRHLAWAGPVLVVGAGVIIGLAFARNAPTAAPADADGVELRVVHAGDGSLIDGPLRLQEGEAIALASVAADAEGAPVAHEARWTTSDTAIATVDASGRVTGRAPGEATVSAVVGTTTHRVPLVIAPRPSTVAIVTGPEARPLRGGLSLEPGQVAGLRGIVRDRRGARLADAVTWSSSDPSVASVSLDGTVRARAPGSARITAASGGISAAFELTVASALEPDLSRAPPTGQPLSTPAANRTPGTLRLRIENTWAYVRVDGELQDPNGSRVVSLSLAPGEHRLVLSRPGWLTLDTVLVIRSGVQTVIVKELRPGGSP